uniref:Gelsolin-like domain-containing protein n=1 Tax=Haptolina ericina TaxID=156174 RepID=A0A7S3EXD0_9EUKA|mmetsp:Transcript_33318/g.75353  ORF Transcript_33318/g.75353 Transcript_33318/m.75353 type:complete len:397 (+) Transcript_33318:88-1278(+)
MQKDRQPDWQDTNMALFGSDIEKKVKEAAADGEPQWTNAGVKVGLQIWRIEQFKVVPWAKSKYGKFHTGDSYIVLNTYIKEPQINPDKLAWDIHFWIGRESTQDEYGTAAYKTVELDDHLHGAATQHREVQESESKMFLGYFSAGLTYLKGGVATGFKHVTTNESSSREARLLMVKGRGGNILLREVDCKRSAMNSGDVFILDCDEGIFQWNGSGSNMHEKSKAQEFTQLLKTDRGGDVSSVVVDEGDASIESKEHPFTKHLPGEWKMMGVKMGDIKMKDASAGGEDDAVKAFEPKLYRLKEGGGASKVGAGKPPINKLLTTGVYVLDDGFRLLLWVGKAAPKGERASAFVSAQMYLKKFKRPPVLPISRYGEGQEDSQFMTLFGPAVHGGCCTIS